MKTLVCNFCNKKFKRKFSQILLANKHYCSNTCRYRGKRSGKNIKCFECDKVIYKSLRDIGRSKSNKNFCSIFCSNRWHGKEFSREKHPNWKSGEFSYRAIFKKHSIIQQCNICKTVDERILMVHHIDKNRKNNEITNLMWLCYNCHFLVHHYPKENFFKK